MKIIAKKDLFINDEIRVREVRLVGLDGEQLGIKPLSEAQAIADDANVDLVLIQPQACLLYTSILNSLAVLFIMKGTNHKLRRRS